METKKVEYTTFDLVYVAADGKEFSDKNECAKYEKTYKCAILAHLRPIIIRETSEYALFDMGNDDNRSFVMVPRTDEDIIHIRQLLAALGTGSPDWLNESIGKPVIVTFDIDEEYAWVTRPENILRGVLGDKFEMTITEKPAEV